jgi:hypothetical protein
LLPCGNELGHPRPNKLLPFDHVPGRLSGYSDIDMHPVFADFGSGTLRNPIAGPLPSGSMIDAPSGSS